MGRRAQQAGQATTIHREPVYPALGPPTCHLAAYRGNLPLQISDTGLSRVALNDLANRGTRPTDLAVAESVLRDLLGDQVDPGAAQQ